MMHSDIEMTPDGRLIKRSQGACSPGVGIT